MSSYLSNLLTSTTSRYNSIRRTLLKDEEDGDTEDDSHISRVLRAYYTEKGRPFPPWLPPDPNDRKAITPQPYMQQQQSSSYFNRGGQMAAVQQQASSRPSSLSDLWDSPGQNNAPMQPQSLRNARRPVARPAPPTSSGATLAPRPLPSQRAGSYQSMQSQASGRSESYGGASTPPAGGGGTAQDRLKARLWGGGRAASPSNAGGSPTPYDQPAYGGGNPYDAGGGGGIGNRRYGRQG